MRAVVFAPALASLLRSRGASIAVILAASAQVVLELLHLPGYSCPLLTATGISCPGCGLKRATAALAHGDFSRMLELHAFAPALAVGLILVAAAAVLPGSWREVFINRIAAFERRTGLTMVVLMALVAYWVVRVVIQTVPSAHHSGT